MQSRSQPVHSEEVLGVKALLLRNVQLLTPRAVTTASGINFVRTFSVAYLMAGIANSLQGTKVAAVKSRIQTKPAANTL